MKVTRPNILRRFSGDSESMTMPSEKASNVRQMPPRGYESEFLQEARENIPYDPKDRPIPSGPRVPELAERHLIAQQKGLELLLPLPWDDRMRVMQWWLIMCDKVDPEERSAVRDELFRAFDKVNDGLPADEETDPTTQPSTGALT